MKNGEKTMKNYMKLEIAAVSENEGFARSAVAAFALTLAPTLTELSDIRTAVSEAVTNCIVHAYGKSEETNAIEIECRAETDGGKRSLHITIADKGCGIENLEKAVTPFYTTLSSEERSGLGFTIMQTFMDEFSLQSELGKGTRVYMQKRIGESEKWTVGNQVNVG